MKRDPISLLLSSSSSSLLSPSWSVNDPAVSFGLRNLAPTILGHPVAGPSSKIRPSGDDGLGPDTKPERERERVMTNRPTNKGEGPRRFIPKGDEKEADAEKRHRLILEYLIKFLDIYL